MGIFRKMTSITTAGLVDYNSSKERTSKAAKRTSKAEAKLLTEQAKTVRAQRRAQH